MRSMIVVPLFNEARRWDDGYWREMSRIDDVTWLFVDDGSTDATPVLLQRASENGLGTVLTLASNSGKAEAVRRGLQSTFDHGVEAIGFMDADGAFNGDDVRQMLYMFDEQRRSEQPVDAVWSSRVALAGRDIRRSARRHYIGRGVATIVSLGQGPIPYDTQSGLKVFDPSPSLRACLATPFRTRWLFELELLVRWRSVCGSPMRIWEEPLSYWHDVAGSKVTSVESARILRELALLKRLQWTGWR